MKIIAIDPGLSGAICVLDENNINVYDMPVRKIKKGKKEKNNFDIPKIVEIIKNNLSSDDENICVIEDVHCSVGNGSVSMFNFGRGKGILEGVSNALGMKVVLVSPQSWKKAYICLETEEIVKLREKQKIKKVDLKVIKIENKSIKDKGLKKSNKIKIKELEKEVEKIGRQIKSLAKDAARSVAAKLVKSMTSSFELKKNDGRAEAVLMAYYLRDHYELVQESEKGEENDND